MWTVLLLQGRVAMRAIGRFKTYDEAKAWAISDGWKLDQFRVVPFND